MKKVLISGGAGFIGSNLALKLVNNGYCVTVMDNLSQQVHGLTPEMNSPLYLSINGKVDFIKGDVTKRSDWEKSLYGQDVIIHLAAETGTGQSMYQIEKYVNVNIGGTAILLDILANNQHEIKKIILASSRAVYGEGEYHCKTHGAVYPDMRKEFDLLKGDFECKCPVCRKKVKLMPTSEDSKMHPSSVYGITKQSQEQMVMTVGKALQIPVVAFRYQNVYGPGQSLSNPYTGILSIFSNQIQNGSNINIFEDGEESRDFVFIDDAVDATILGLEKDEADYEIFNVGSGLTTDVLTVASTLTSKYGSNVEIKVNGNFRFGDIRHNYADLTKIRQRLGYTPRLSFNEGIDLFSKWVDQQLVSPNNYDQSIKELKEKRLYR